MRAMWAPLLSAATLLGLYLYQQGNRYRIRLSSPLAKRLIPNAWVQADPNKRPVFFIGFHKTGTSYYSHYFEELGFRVMHDSHWRHGSIAVIEEYDMFFDGCLHQFETMHRHYPQAKFILNTRPLRDWLISRMAWSDWGNRWSPLEKRLMNPVARLLWGNDSYYDLERVSHWIRERRAYHQRVLHYFAEHPDKLLVVNLEDPLKLQQLSEFLSLGLSENSTEKRPKRNASDPAQKVRYEALADQALEACQVHTPHELV